MGFIAEIYVAHDELVLAPTIDHHPDVTIRYEYEVETAETMTYFVSVFTDEYDHLEATMEADPTVSDPACIATFENRAIYRVRVETDRHLVPERCAERGLFVFTITSGDGGWDARVHFPNRETLAAFREYCREQGMTFRVNQLYESSASDDGTYFLTEQQHEILSMAYYAGYYDIPRGVTQDDLAEQLDITDSAVSQRLRRAVGELIGATLDDERTPDEYR
ncbi:bacterio-opsin activator HTH domain-containing protein [Natrialba hulunbeirensis JCM 10989]|uniref:Bacterio-opsin activator HTH domain-containing protein n=1 Tax=Natrialba hulunbeirensis JCM 10989 TaxID=1227493 RepID=L9ZMJ8_9EURY|nr:MULTISPECIES: helix-turn-helix domain-containing protein [Natrialba]ELY87750.1 bacterio-opsin activator HTH domain-containing protein [Natrialba hulunbeirensis JCM 10989]OIB56957.1 bacterio-opsin activator [Natrialba sp. SSL1]